MNAMLPLILCLGFVPPPPQEKAGADAPTVRIGVLSFRGSEETAKRWGPIGEFLKARLPEYHFVMQPLSFDDLESTVASGQLDFVYCNPAQYVLFESRYGVSACLTVRLRHAGKASGVSGAAIFTRAGRADLTSIEQLRRKSFIAVDERSWGGWLLAARELKSRGIDPKRDLAALEFPDSIEAVVKGVRDGRFDAGTVRADILERLIAQGVIGKNDLAILNRQPRAPEYPFPTSTRLYPEWPLAVMPHTPTEIASRVARVLLDVGPDDPAARAAGIYGWGPPLNYMAADALLRDLGLPPHEKQVEVSLEAVVTQYRYLVIGTFLILSAMIGSIAYVVWMNRRHAKLSRRLETQLAERENTERLLQESEVFYHSLVETLPQNILRKDREGRFTFGNSRFCDMIGHPAAEIIGKTDLDFFPRELAEKYRGDDARVMESGQPIDVVEPHVTPDGQTHYVHVIKTPLRDDHGHVMGTQGIFWDVTALHRAEEESRRSRERFELAVRGSQDGIWDWDIVVNKVYFSPQWKAQLGYEETEVGDNFAEWESRLHPEDRERALATLHAYLAGDVAEYEMEHRLAHKSGGYRWILTRAVLLRDEAGKPYRMAGSHTDITGFKEVTEQVRLGRERFELAVLGSRDGIWDWDLTTDEVYYSQRYKELLGYTDDGFPNLLESFVERLHPEDHERVMDAVIEHIRRRVPFDVECRLRASGGEFRWFQLRAQAIWDAAGEASRMAGSLTDITERKQFEQQLLEQNQLLQKMALSERQAHEELKNAQSKIVSTAKLAGLGQMVAGVAHEINNPLSFVGNNVAVLQRDLGEIEQLLELYRQAEPSISDSCPELMSRIRELCERVDMAYTLDNIQGVLGRTRDGLRRIQQIVKDLRVFARLDESDINEVDLNAGIESTLNIIAGHARKKQVKLDVDLAPLPQVVCLAAKINQVIMNIVANAIDASAEGGVVAIRTRQEPDERGVRIEIEDHGTGIDSAIRERIFDPFFTTKPVGVGTGLGLSISYGIIQDHGGTIDLDSEPGVGTRFTIHLPLKIVRKPGRGGTAPGHVEAKETRPAEVVGSRVVAENSH